MRLGGRPEIKADLSGELLHLSVLYGTVLYRTVLYSESRLPIALLRPETANSSVELRAIPFHSLVGDRTSARRDCTYSVR
jgi:hypothetical protein